LSNIRIDLGKTLAAMAIVAGLGVARDAHATLGGDVASVAANQQNLSATRVVTKTTFGDRHDLVLASGVVVHEYISPAGAVYAVTWRGPRMPDLRELLGPYFTQLSSKSKRGGHHHATLTGTDLVVQSQGHGHAFSGRAWAPSLVPAGVKIDASLE
jgi:hypothetical protein